MIMRSSAALALLMLIVPLASAQGPAGRKAPAKPVVITGSSTVYPLMLDIVQRFKELNPGVAIEVRSGGSGKGIADLRAGVSDIAMVSRSLSESERDLFPYSLCQDGAALVVHASNPVKGLSRRQLTQLVTGHVTDWKQLGGHAGAIKLVWRHEGQGIPELLRRSLKLKPEQIRSHTTIFENAEAIAFVAKDRNAITAAALGVAEGSVKAGAPVKLLAYAGVPASTRTVRARAYSLSRPLVLVTRSIPAGVQKKLVDYATSRAMNDIYQKHGFVPYED
jgi:phosphate transport system substrate-binding protein